MADLKRAYRELDPAQPARNAQQYVPRPGDPMGVLGEELKIRTSPLHVLVGGQRGVGKTTELIRLRDTLEGERLPHTLLTPDRVIESHPSTFLRDLYHSLVREHSPVDYVEKAATETEVKHLLRQICSASGHSFTCLMDGLEKFESSDVLPYVTAMADVPCSFVLVVPMSLLLSSQFTSAIGEWDRVISVPAITLVDREGIPYWEGLAVLRTIVERRAGADAFERPALDLVIEASGGVHRELLILAQQACLRAAVGGRVQVREQDARNAVEDRRQEVSLHLTPQDLDYLDEIHKHHRITGDPLALPLVERNLIIGYHGGWSWFDVHPIVKPLLDAHRKGSGR